MDDKITQTNNSKSKSITLKIFIFFLLLLGFGIIFLINVNNLDNSKLSDFFNSYKNNLVKKVSSSIDYLNGILNKDKASYLAIPNTELPQKIESNKPEPEPEDPILKDEDIYPDQPLENKNTPVVNEVGLVGPKGSQGPIGPQGSKGEPGRDAVNIDTSGFVLSSFLTRQVERIYDSVNNNIKNLSDSLDEEVQTGLLNVSGNGFIVGDLTVTGNLIATVAGSITTATSLALDPTDCGAGTWATAIDKEGDLTCSSMSPELDTLAIVTSRGSITNGQTLTVGPSATYDPITLSAIDKGATSYNGTITSLDLTAARTWTLPDNTGTIALISDITGASSHNPVTLGTANGLSLSTQQLSLGLASSGVTGALSGTDWNTFNNKQSAGSYALTTGTLGQFAATTSAQLLGVLSDESGTGNILTTTGSGANLTSLTAANLSGTIPSAVLGNSSLFVGTTSIALNRASADLALTGISSITTPLVLGGTSTTQDLTLQTTSGAGATGADMHFLVGNNGAIEAMTILNNGNVGIGTTNPRTTLEVNDALLVTGLDSRGWVEPNIGEGTRLLFYPRKWAFRAGYVSNTQWDNANIGDGSVAMGTRNIASGNNSFAMGVDSIASGSTSVSMGADSIASGHGTIAIGSTANALNSYSVAIGSDIYNNARYSVAIGTGLKSDSYASAVLGQFNVGGGTLDSWVATDTIFEIGIGSSDVSRANALTVLKNGSVGIGTTTPTATLHLKAGTATANTAPLKLTSGTNLTTAEAGAMEWDGTNLFVTQITGPTRKTLAYTTDIAAQVYPGAGISNSTGSAWGPSYTTTGSGSVIALQNSPSFITPSLGVATATSINNLSLSQDNTDFNIKVGKDSGLNLLAGAINNTFVGYEAGKSGLIGGGTSPDSSDNTAVGYQSFYSNTTGGGSTALGSWTMFSNTTGQDNTALGYYSMYSNTTGSGNTGVGEFTLSDNNGDYNVAVGLNSLTFNTLGNNNSSYGASSLKNNTTGSYNVAVGNFAGRYLSDGTTGRISGNNGLYLGYNSKSSADGTDNEIVIGYNAIGKGSNTATYGNSSMTKHVFEAGNVGIGTTTPTSQLTQKSTTALEGPTLAAELLSSSNWTATNWTGDFSSGFSHTTGNTTALTNTLAAVVNVYYQIAFTVTGRTAGSFTVAFGGETSGSNTVTGAFGPKAATTGTLSINPTTDFDGTIVISIKQITTGTPATYAIQDSDGNTSFQIRNSLASRNSTFVGMGAGRINTTGSWNSAYGYNTLFINTTGNYNTAMGAASLYSNTTGYNNSALGTYSLFANTTGIYNAAMGSGALYSNTTGNNNVSVGYLASYHNTTGSNNTTLGYYAGRYLADGNTGRTTGNNGIYLGSNSKASADGTDNEIAIGTNAIGAGSNTAVIGNSALTSVYFGSTTPNARLFSKGLTLSAGTATAGTSPLKFTSGTLLGTTEAGAIEFNNDAFYGTITTGAGTAGARKQFAFTTDLTTGYVPYTGASSNVNLGTYSLTSPNIIGGSTTTSDLSLQTTSGVGATGADMHFLVGNNGATEAMTILNSGNVGVGTTNPGLKLDVSGITGYPATSGSTQTGVFRVSQPGAVVMDMGIANASPYGGWIQVSHNSNLSVNYPLLLNPNGGNVSIGTTSPVYKLDVKGTSATDGIRSDIGFDINPVPNPTAPTGVVSVGGSVDTGVHYYRVTYTTALGETNSVGSAAITTTAGNNTVTLTIPVSTDPRVTGRKLYRTKAGGNNFEEYALATIANNTATSYVDTVADSSLAGVSGVAFFRINTTSKNITVAGVNSFILDRNITSLGISSGASLTTGGRNSFFGFNTGNANTGANDNSAFGHQALENATTGGANSAFGSYSLKAINTGFNNTAQGAYSGFSMTTGIYNTTIGNSSLYGMTDGSYNTALGANAGRYITDGTTLNTTSDTSIYLGYGTKASADNNQNEIVIGYNAIGKGSNTVTLGTGNVLYSGGSTISGIVARFTNSTGTCDINPTTSSLVCSSDISLKKNIVVVAEGNEDFILNENIQIPETTLDKLTALTPVTYNWLTEVDGDSKHVGLIAQEVGQIFPDVVFVESETGIKSIAYTNLIPYIIESIKEMNLKLLDINNMEKENSFRDSLVAWFGNEMNGITELFTKKIRTEQVCLKKSDGTDFCVNGDQLEEIINRGQVNTGSSTTIQEPEIISTEVNPSEDTTVNTDSPTEIPTDENPLTPDSPSDEILQVVEVENITPEPDIPSQNEDMPTNIGDLVLE